MLFAEIRGIPTVNGYSSWFPDGWALDDPASPGYAAAVRDWAAATASGRACAGSTHAPDGGRRGCPDSQPSQLARVRIHLDAGGLGLVENVGLEHRNPAGFDAFVLEALGDDLVDDRLEQIGMRERRKCFQQIPDVIVVDERACPHGTGRQAGKHLDGDFQPVRPIGVPLPRVQAAAPFDDRVHDDGPHMVTRGKFGMHTATFFESLNAAESVACAAWQWRPFNPSLCCAPRCAARRSSSG